MLKKIKYIIKQRYNPYPLYWFDLLTERHLKNRVGECIDCVECCRYICGCYCHNIDIVNKRCKVYPKSDCDIWFPVSQKEIDYRSKIQPGFKCKFSFSYKPTSICLGDKGKVKGVERSEWTVVGEKMIVSPFPHSYERIFAL